MKEFLKLLGCVVALLWVCNAFAGVKIVKNGQALAEIVLPEKPLSSVTLAAEDLQKHIELISGAKLPIGTKPTAGVENQIYVGESDYTRKLGVTTDDLKVEGFKIIAKDHYVIVVGRDEQRAPFPYADSTRDGLKKWQDFTGEKYAFSSAIGAPGVYNQKLGIFTLDATATYYGVAELLEELGVRFYAPYENGTVIPNLKTVVIANQQISKEPKYPYRDFCYYNFMRKDVEGVKWIKRLKYGASYLHHMGHSTWDIINTLEQMKLHPEYYAQTDGKPIIGMGGRGIPRFCDPGFRQTSLHYLDKVFEAYPPLVGMSLGPPDGFDRMDERDAKIWGRPDKGRGGKLSDYMWDYWLSAARELKKSHPDKYLATWAYALQLEPPSGIDKLPDNVTLTICGSSGYNLLDPEAAKTRELRAQWLSMLTSKKLFLWEWYLFYYPNGKPRYPVVFTKLLQRDMKELSGICEGKFMEISPDDVNWKIGCPGLSHLLYYLQGKLFWDPDLDLQKLLKEYYALYFGPAKAEMKEFYEFAEEVWTRPKSRSVSNDGQGFLLEKDVDRYFGILKRAREKAGKDSVYDKRIAQIETEMAPLSKLFSNMKRVGPSFRAYPASEPILLDGDLNKPIWHPSHIIWYGMKDVVTGKTPRKNGASVAFRMSPDKAALFIGVSCDEAKMDKLIANTSKHDDPGIFNDDVVEIYIQTPERSYFRIAVNPNGANLDESQDITMITRDTLPVLWNPGVVAVIKKEKDRWMAEIKIPTKDFGSLGPDPTYTWGINVCRSRRAGGAQEAYAISPTGIPQFLELSKLGNLWMK